MKSGATIGIILIILGIAALAYQGITYTKKETVLNVGPLHAEAEHQHTIPIPPIVGIAAIAGGIFLVIRDSRHQ